MDSNPLGSYLDSMEGPTPRASPGQSRSPRGRSEYAGSDPNNDRERSRGRRGEAIGVGFRLNSCEQSLTQHHAELAAQKVELVQLKEAVLQLVADKTITGQRLDECFNQVEKVHGECQAQTRKAFDIVESRLKTTTDTLTNITQMVSEKFGSIDLELARLQALCASIGAAAFQPPDPPPGMQAPPSWEGPRMDTPPRSEPDQTTTGQPTH